MSKSKHRTKMKNKTKRPILFSEFGQKARDLLTSGYSENKKFSVSSNIASGLTLTLTGLRDGRKSNAAVSAVYNYKNASNIAVRVDTRKPKISATLTLTKKFLPSLSTQAMASFKLLDYTRKPKWLQISASTLMLTKKFLPSTEATASFNMLDYSSSKFRFQFLHEHVALAISIAMNRSPEISFSASVGTSSIAFGIKGKYKTDSSSFSMYNAGIHMIKHNHNASILWTNKGELLTGSYLHYLDEEKKISAVVEITRSLSKQRSTFIAGGSWAVDGMTVLKARLENNGKLKVLVRHNFKTKSYFTVSSEFDTKSVNKIPKIGLALVLVL